MARSNKAPQPSERRSGRYAYEGLQRPIHEKARLGIMTSLVSHADGLSFNDLKVLCDLTDGNLNRHLEVLREAGLISVEKGQSGERRQTWCRMTDRGQAEFAAYLAELERVVADAAQTAAAAKRPGMGWSPA
ncbi:MAG: transcriptional regulator [Pirellulales bacterium]|nr:transcriptional regulator [Pirellulales bacterium]